MKKHSGHRAKHIRTHPRRDGWCDLDTRWNSANCKSHCCLWLPCSLNAAGCETYSTRIGKKHCRFYLAKRIMVIWYQPSSKQPTVHLQRKSLGQGVDEIDETFVMKTVGQNFPSYGNSHPTRTHSSQRHWWKKSSGMFCKNMSLSWDFIAKIKKTMNLLLIMLRQIKSCS